MHQHSPTNPDQAAPQDLPESTKPHRQSPRLPGNRLRQAISILVGNDRMSELNPTEQGLQVLRDSVNRYRWPHWIAKWTDSIFYNWGIVAVFLATAAATILPSEAGQQLVGVPIPRLLTGFATFWIAVERGLAFGLRWRFHLHMEQEYLTLRDRIDHCRHLSGSRREECEKKIVEDFVEVREREHLLPGIGTPDALGLRSASPPESGRARNRGANV